MRTNRSLLLGLSLITGCIGEVSVDETEIEPSLGANQAPLVDKRFNESGTWVSTSASGDEIQGEAVASDSSGRILVGSTYQGLTGPRFRVHRLKHDGTLDTDFGAGGFATVDVGGTAQELRDILVDGTKIVAVGTKKWNGTNLFVAVRLTSTGAQDTTFNTSGIQALGFTGANAIASEVVKFGTSYALGGSATATDGTTQTFALAILTSAGAPQNTFSGDAKHTVDFANSTKERVTGLAVVPHASGNILAAVGPVTVTGGPVQGVGLVGLTATGAMHTGFNGGVVRVHSVASTPLYPAAVAVDGSNLMVTGYAAPAGVNQGFVSRYVNGAPQTMASGTTVQLSNFGRPRAELVSIARTPTGAFIVGGVAYDANSTNFMNVLASVTATGAFNTAFDGDGMIVRPLADATSGDPSYLTQEEMTDMVLTSNARIYSAGVVSHNPRGNESFALVHDVEPSISRFDASGATTPSWVNSYLLGRLSDIVYLNSATDRANQLKTLGSSITETNFINIASTDAQAMIARTSTALFVVVRGTEETSADDIITDIRAISRVTTVDGFQIHRGFYEEMQSLKQPVIDAVRANLGSRKLWVAGHSLGGATAHLLAWELRRAGFTATRVTTFAAPMSGDPVWAAAYDAALGSVTDRFVLAGDWVPTLPFLDTKYKHVGRQHYIDWTSGTTVMNWDDTAFHDAPIVSNPTFTYHLLHKYYGNLIHLMPASLHY